MTYKKERNEDFINAYHQAMKSFGKLAPYVSRMEVVRRTISSPARYYVQYEEARRRVRRILTGRPIACRNPRKNDMYEALAEQVQNYMKRKPLATFNDALYTVLAEEKAPCFYLTEESALLLLYQLQKGETV